jgi:DNA-binding MarR family transcriptional regulator
MSSPVETKPDIATRLVEKHRCLRQTFERWAGSLIESRCGSPARMRLLGALHCKGPQIMADLGSELGVSARQVTNLVDALEKEALVRREPHPTDRRATVIELTKEGCKHAERLWQPFLDELASLYRELSEKDQRELLRLMEMLLDKLRRRFEDGQARSCPP